MDPANERGNTCQNCKAINSLIIDYKTGEIVCTNCGLINDINGN